MQDGVPYPSVGEEARNDLLMEMKHENFEAYGREIADAARKGDIEGMKKHVDSGKTLQCCNKFKESILHLVCRRGHEDILKFMLEETDVSACIQDDLGRTPLHELAWTSVPNFSMVKMILQKSPDLLYLKDNRQFTPLHYVGKNNWDAWCEFLDANRDLLASRAL
jgi:ankyrin repeat protein